MTKKIQCQNACDKEQNLKVRIIKAPLVDSLELHWLVNARTRAIVL